ncbi:MAG: cation diffusion facilitator family transporter [Gammaproteobacteria bacterium]|nr:cation diffusion facilitator family transporter [Gammaproteobacteria bacterium]
MATSHGSPVKAILYAFFANLGIALAKSAAALYTGSSSMLAEAIHSFADTGNQLLLLLGLRRAARAADAEHPLGYGKITYFWSFIVAVLLFSVGGLFSLYEGWHKLHAPAELSAAWVALLVLGVSMALEAASMYGCLVEVNKLRGRRSLWRWLHESRNSELVVVFGEDFAALLGLSFAFAFVAVAAVTGNPMWDALGSIVIGVLLVVVAGFVAVRVKVLLIGRSADPDVVEAVREHIAGDDGIVEVFNIITLQMGPQVVLAAKIRLRAGSSIDEGCERINSLERALRSRFPEIGWCFVEPDVSD